jgi:hypothetical protein
MDIASLELEFGQLRTSEKELLAMLKKLIMVLVLSLVTALFLVCGAMAAKLLCVSNETLHGQESAASCLAKGDEFAIVDQFGAVRILSKREVELTKAFNPNFFNQPAWSFKFQKEAPELKVFGSVPLPRSK